MAITAIILKKSINVQGDILTTFELDMPRIILSEFSKHREFSFNTSSSRAITFNKMIETVEKSPFIPIAWQKHHKGMQGSEYVTDTNEILNLRKQWYNSSKKAIEEAKQLNSMGVTKQLCNRLLEPFVFVKVIMTTSEQGLRNFFELRCPKYYLNDTDFYFKSKQEYVQYCSKNDLGIEDIDWFAINKSTAEIHIQELAEQMYNAFENTTAELIKPDEWHIPDEAFIGLDYPGISLEDKIKVAISRAARTSYTTIEGNKDVPLEKHRELYQLLIDENHYTPLEHCLRAMDEREYLSFNRGASLSNPFSDNVYYLDRNAKGWCKNHKGFISMRYLVENSLDF